MGLDCSHSAWHGAYTAFHRWRKALAQAAELPPIDLMEGFYGHGGRTFEGVEGLPILWSALKPDPLHLLLHHSDCDGEIAPEDCGPIADSLERLLPKLGDDGEGHIAHRGGMRAVTEQFIRGLRAAAAAGEPLDFH